MLVGHFLLKCACVLSYTNGFIQGPEKLRGDSLETTAFGRYGVKTSEKANMIMSTAVLLQRPLAQCFDDRGF